MKKYGVMQLIGCLALLLAGCSDKKPKVIEVKSVDTIGPRSIVDPDDDIPLDTRHIM